MTVGILKRSVFGLVMALAGVSVTAQAAQMAPDLRNTQPSVLRDGDFDGDGRLDTLNLVNEADTGRIAVHVRLAGEDVRVTSFDAASAPVVRVVPAGTYEVDCGSFATDCKGQAVQTRADSLIVAVDGGVSLLMYWRDGAFEPEFVRSEEDSMARVAAMLTALNP